jgi:single-stranded DNA-specific DHH superfamily exonuclease
MKQDFLNFIKSISKKDKIAIFTHNDLDGIASAIFIEEILVKRKSKIEIIDFLEYRKDMLIEVLKKLRKANITKVFILDVNVDNIDLDSFEKLRKEYDVLFIDHHPINPKILDRKNIIKTDTEDCVALTVYRYGKRLFNRRKWNWLLGPTMVTEFSTKKPNNMKFLKTISPKVKKDKLSESIPGKLAKKIGSLLIYFDKNLKKAYTLIKEKDLSEVEKIHEIVSKEVNRCVKKYLTETEFFPEKNLYFYYINPKFNISNIVTTIVSLKNPEKTCIGLSGSGKNFIRISARNQSGKENMDSLMKKGIKGLKNASCGGHVKASGARIMKKDLGKFKENILTFAD